MINIGFGPNILLGLILGFGVILLYFLRIVKPEVARDEDIFFATMDDSSFTFSGLPWPFRLCKLAP